MNNPAKAQEWHSFWPLPFVAMFGMAGSGITVYSTGVFMGELMREFGWSRTQYSSAMTVQVLLTLVLIPLVGRAVDRFGPRRVALIALAPTIIGTSMLGLANGALWQWWLLTCIQTIGTIMLIPPVWITAVVGQFHVSRGLALAVALAGLGMGTALWPILAAFYIEHLGWRLAYGAIALSWGAIIIPLTIFCFYGPQDRVARRDKPVRVALPYAHHLKSRTFLCLAGAGGLFVMISQAMTLNLVPILQGSGLSRGDAAALAGIAGLSSIIGRLTMGFLLDLMPAKPLGIAMFLLPVLSALILIYSGDSFPLALVAAALLGLSLGGEGDVLNYMASRRFDHAIFGSIASFIQTVTAVTSVSGMMLAGILADFWGSYELFLMLGIPVTLAGAVFLAMVPSVAPIVATPQEEEISGVIPMTNQPLLD